MVEKMKNLMANSILYLGTIICIIGEKIVRLGIKVHMKLDTENGKKFKQVENLISELGNLAKTLKNDQRGNNGAIFLKNKN